MVQELRLLREAVAAASTRAVPGDSAAPGSNTVSGLPGVGGIHGMAGATAAGDGGVVVPAMPASGSCGPAKPEYALVVAEC